jgi:hypothetical protein
MADTADVEFFWDPMCPWAWITSRWVAEVARQSDYTVNWRFICLRLLNEHKDYNKDFPEGYIAGHGTGQKLLRVAAAIREAEGPARMGELYTRWGTDIHVRRRRPEIVEQYEAGLPDYLRETGIEARYIAEANNDAWDDLLRAERDEALELTGKDVGTPIIGYNRDGLKQAFFGPVISEIPPRERAVELWDAVWALATVKGFAELKRSLRDRPNTQESLYN